MHFYCLAIGPDTDEELEDLMAPYSEEPDYNPHSFWDWYQIGGRWTGHLTDYDPSKDENNIEPCRWCNATGHRDDEVGRKARVENPDFTCNGCQGTGKELKWPTSWVRYSGDRLPASQVIQILKADPSKFPYSYIHANGFFEKEDWNDSDVVENKEFAEGLLAFLKSVPPDTTVTVVDYHC